MSAHPLLLSFQIALIATLLAGVAGTALAAAMLHRRFPGANLVLALVTAPMVLPPTVLGYYLLVLLGRQSAVGRVWEAVFGGPLVFTPAAAVVAAFVGALPFVVKSVRAAMLDVDPRLVAAARTLGASPARVLLRVVLPLSRGGLVAGLTLGFARALGDFGATLMVAGNIPGVTRTGALAIYDAVQANREAEAGGMAALMSAIAIVALYGAEQLTRRRPHAW